MRGLRNLNLLDYSHPVTDLVGAFNNEANLNNLQIVYGNSTDKYSKAKMYWTAAHANNAVHEWYDFAGESGIDPPPSDLKILCTPFAGDAAAPMFHQIFGLALPLIGGAVGNALAAAGISMAGFVQFLFPELALASGIMQAASITLPFLTTYFTTFLPDVVLTVSNNPSDIVKRTDYHELAHAVHYRKVGNSYWISEINYTIAHTGYGDGTDPGADRVEVVETWGNEMGYYLADRYYGLNHSNNNTPNPDNQTPMRHLYGLENPKYYDPPNEFIPVGLFRDLVDDNSQNPLQGPNGLVGVYENSTVTDDVKDFTHLQLYSALASDVTSIPTFRTQLTAIVPGLNSNTQTDFNALFSSYGY